jgi:DNA-binding transcriptional ArsR family regulator
MKGRPSVAVQIHREQEIARLSREGLTAGEIAASLDIDDRTVRRYRAMARTDDEPLRRQERERLRLERALITGLSSGGTVLAIAAASGVPHRVLTYHLDQLKIRYGARTAAHLVAIIAALRPCPHCGHVP